MKRRVRGAAMLAILLGLAAGVAAQSDTDKSPAEARALGYIHTVITAQREYKKKHSEYARSLTALVGKGSFTRRMANPDRGDYAVKFSANGTGYSLSLIPKTFDAEHRAFFASETGTIRVEPDKPATAQSPPLKQ
jgi:hypothetical protein